MKLIKQALDAIQPITYCKIGGQSHLAPRKGERYCDKCLQSLRLVRGPV